jgi:hypothetical protein
MGQVLTLGTAPLKRDPRSRAAARSDYDTARNAARVFAIRCSGQSNREDASGGPAFPAGARAGPAHEKQEDTRRGPRVFLASGTT